MSLLVGHPEGAPPSGGVRVRRRRLIGRARKLRQQPVGRTAACSSMVVNRRVSSAKRRTSPCSPSAAAIRSASGSAPRRLASQAQSHGGGPEPSRQLTRHVRASSRRPRSRLRAAAEISQIPARCPNRRFRAASSSHSRISVSVYAVAASGRGDGDDGCHEGPGLEKAGVCDLVLQHDHLIERSLPVAGGDSCVGDHEASGDDPVAEAAAVSGLDRRRRLLQDHGRSGLKRTHQSVMVLDPRHIAPDAVASGRPHEPGRSRCIQSPAPRAARPSARHT